MDFNKYQNHKVFEGDGKLWREEEMRIRDTFKEDAFQELSIENHPKSELAFDLACIYAHQSEFSLGYPYFEVFSCLENLSRLLK